MSALEINRILYVEPDSDIRTMATIALEVVGGFSVKACSCGAEAITGVGEFEPDLLLLDVMTPEMDGPTTLAQLRQIAVTATTPVIFMTATANESEIDLCKLLGAIGVIAKPFDPMELAQQIVQIWQDRPELPLA